MKYSLKNRINYWRRIFKVYLTKIPSYLNFWHEVPRVHENITPDRLGVYYMTFEDKAGYSGPRDKDGVILFEYHAQIGTQYNPVAIAQYGLGNYNLFLDSGDKNFLKEAKIHARWLVENLEKSEKGILVWKHHFEWQYKELLPSGWYSALSQGSGISLLTRMYKETGDDKYIKAAKDAMSSMFIEMENGGVMHTDKSGNVWLEEYMVYPPTHILNGFIWAIWGVWDYYLVTKDKQVLELFKKCMETLKLNIDNYDTGTWSLYDLSKQAMKMVASPFYHSLHIVQLKATYVLTGDKIFEDYADKFYEYQNSRWKRYGALVYKSVFKLLYF